MASKPTVAGRYRVERRLCVSARSEVLAAYDTLLRERVALKRAHGPDAGNERLLNEAKLAIRIRHPNVCRVHGADVERTAGARQRVFLTMQRLEGPSLRELVLADALPAELVPDMARQIASGLAGIHAARVLHCNLTLGSVIVLGWPTRPRALIASSGSSLDLSSLDPGAAPEVLSRRALGTSTDLQSFGVLLLQLLGVLPVFTPPDEPRSADPSPGLCAGSCARISSELEAVARRCLSPDPAERFADAVQLGHALGLHDPNERRLAMAWPSEPPPRIRSGQTNASAGDEQMVLSMPFIEGGIRHLLTHHVDTISDSAGVSVTGVSLTEHGVSETLSPARSRAS